MSYVAQIDLSLAPKLQKGLKEKGFTLSQPPHTLFQGKGNGVTCTLYTSGKLVVQGKQMKEFIEFYLEPEILHTFTYSYETKTETELDLTPRIGVDESGKGDFFGPLCIAGLYADCDSISDLQKLGVKDSKLLTDKAILKIAQSLRKSFPYYLVRIGPKKYNELYEQFRNLNLLLGWGHATVIENLLERTPCKRVIIDKFAAEHVVENALLRKKKEATLIQRTKGEQDPVVAAASILARAAFVEGIEKLGKEVGLTLPKGASSKTIEAGKKFVAKHGPEALSYVGKMHFKTSQIILATKIFTLALLILMTPLLLVGEIWDESVFEVENTPPPFYPFSISGNYLGMAKADFRTSGLEESDLVYNQADAAFAFTYSCSPVWGWIFGTGWVGTEVNMKDNPEFEETEFHYVNLSCGAFTKAFPDWTWTLTLAAFFDTAEFSLIDYTLYQGVLWGKYDFCKWLEFDFGLITEVGLSKEKIWPILGFVYQISDCLRLNAVYPINIALEYAVSPSIQVAASIRFLRNRHRVLPTEPNPRGIFEYHTTGAELDLIYSPIEILSIKGYAGSTSDGDLKITNQNDHDATHFKFDGSFYAGITAVVVF
ncbi:MAG: Ribonuclease HIII [Chlamydiae bacterium]|nr:Ribonuclease HIII [Chlamydiota bacterium]